MSSLKEQIIDKFRDDISKLDLTQDNHILELKFNTLAEELFVFIKLKKEKNNISNAQYISNEDLSSKYFDDMQILSLGKSSETLLETTDNISAKNINNTPSQSYENLATIIPDNFTLTYDMKQYAKLKFVDNVENIFEHFKLHYQGNKTLKSDWEAVWKIWVLNQNRYKNTHLIKTIIDEDLELANNYLNIAKKYIQKNIQNEEFTKFKNYYIANGDLKVHSQWEKVWENWCINAKIFKPKEQSAKQQEKADYRWDFRKAKESSDKIKQWLEFEKGINWLEDFYLKDIQLPGIGWSDVIHPDYNKEEILLYKIDSQNGQYMLNNKSDDIIDTEVLRND